MCRREEGRRRFPPPLKRTTSAYSSWTDLCFTDRPRKNTPSPAPRIPPVMSTTTHACPTTPQSYTNIQETSTDVTEVLLLRASARDLHPSSPMSLSAERDGDTDGPCKHVPHPPSCQEWPDTRPHDVTHTHTHTNTQPVAVVPSLGPPPQSCAMPLPRHTNTEQSVGTDSDDWKASDPGD